MHTLSKRDPVPALRRELDLHRLPTGAGAEVFRLRPGGGLVPQLWHGYELSIARMLDGQRTVEDVLTNCERIGLPMDLAALEGLLERFEKAGFLADAQHPGVGAHDPRVQHRDRWTPEVRDLFREALRSAREGDVQAAEDAVNGLLLMAPGTGEALQLRGWLERQPKRGGGAKALQTELRQAEASWRGGTPPPNLKKPIRKFFARPPRALLPAVVVAGCLGLLALTTFLPVSRLELARVRLEPISRQPVLAAAPRVVEAVLVKDGDLVTQGQPLLRWKAASEDDALLRAPVAGEVRGLRLKVDQKAQANQELLQLIDRTQMRLVATVTPRAAKHTKPGDVITVDLPGRTVSAVVEAVNDYELIGQVPNADRSLSMKSVAANVELPPRSLWQTLR